MKNDQSSSDEFLAEGFKNVDATQSKKAYFDCLNFLNTLPYYQNIKKKSFDLLQLTPGVTVLDAGCGLGDDVFRMAKLVMPGGSVTGIDASQAMITQAKANPLSKQLPVHFIETDIKTLPFPDKAFRRCRTDRTLQHVPEPQKAIAEMIRVLSPGGFLLAYDNDWQTFSITSEKNMTNRTMEDFWTNSFVNRRIGSQMAEYFKNSGLTDVAGYSSTSVIKDFETADKVYNLRQTMLRAASEGLIRLEEGKRWIKDLLRQQDNGEFEVTLTSYTVIARKIF